jgi:putative transposase
MRDTAGANDDLPLRERVMEARKRHHRRSVRWAGHDYARAGAYFVTICTHGHVCLFGRVVGEAMELNAAGRTVERCWCGIPGHFSQVELDAFVVMPNHVHGILIVMDADCGQCVGTNDAGANDDSPLPPGERGTITPMHHRIARTRGTSNTVGSIVRGFKIGVTTWMRRNTKISDVWQRSYYEHVIRDQRSLQRIRRYITDNPATWAQDPERGGE